MLLLSEVGWEMNRWATVKQFTAWLGEWFPRPGRVEIADAIKSVTWAGQADLLPGRAEHGAKKSWLGSFYRRIREPRAAGKWPPKRPLENWRNYSTWS